MSNSAITGPILSDVRRSPSGSAAAPSWSFADSTATGVYLASTDVLALSTAGVQRVVVDASGNVGIGTASPGSKLTVVDSVCTIESADTNGYARISGASSNAQLGLFRSGTSVGGGYIGANDAASFIVMNSAFAERMRIDANGNLHVGRTVGGGSITGTTLGLTPNGAGYNEAVSASTTPSLAIWYMNRQSSDGTAIEFRRASQKVGSITVNSSNTQYLESASDYRLKEAIAPLEGGLAKVCAMKPVSFKWKESQKEDYGFIAHELQAVIPQAISGEKDAVDAEGNPEYQSIFPAPAQMVASLVAAIQELKAELDEAKAKIAALESKP